MFIVMLNLKVLYVQEYDTWTYTVLLGTGNAVGKWDKL